MTDRFPEVGVGRLSVMLGDVGGSGGSGVSVVNDLSGGGSCKCWFMAGVGSSGESAAAGGFEKPTAEPCLGFKLEFVDVASWRALCSGGVTPRSAASGGGE